MLDYCGRPENFNELLWKGLNLVSNSDILIHLGDICIGKDNDVHERLSGYKFKKILVRGNHDHKSNNWYLSHGWDFVCDTFSATLFGRSILFSHEPVDISNRYDIDFNVHGHCHNSTRDAIVDERHILYAPELNNYKPVNLQKML